MTLFAAAQTAAQSNRGKSALSLELGKTGLLISLGLDHKFADSHLGLRLGAGSNFARNLNAFSAGGGAYYLVGGKTYFFEAGIDLQYLVVDEVSDDQKGVTLFYPDYSFKAIYPSVNVGYRRYGKRSLFRLGISPGLISGDLVPGGYVSYGLTL